MSRRTQAQRILDYITEFGSITQYEALRDLGVMRLASRVSDLKKQGWPIKGEVVAVKNRYDENCYIKKYSLGGVDLVQRQQNVPATEEAEGGTEMQV